MSRVCTICRHERCDAINRALVAGRAHRAIAADFGVSDDAITRHSAAHLPATLLKAKESDDAGRAIDIVKQIKAINAATLQILNEARLAGNGELVLKAVDRVQRQIELQAKLLGDLSDQPQVNILASAEWIALRATLISVLCDFPDAQAAVIARLHPPQDSTGRAS